MTTFDQPAFDFDAVSAPIEGETLATVQLVGNDWLDDRDWIRFQNYCVLLGEAYRGVVNPNYVREGIGGSIEPKRYASFWSKATSKAGFLDNIPGPDGWTTNTDTAGGNAGKPIRLRRLRRSP